MKVTYKHISSAQIIMIVYLKLILLLKRYMYQIVTLDNY